MTPMMEQYLKIKEQNPDCILFFRLGDFYEMFFEDAKLASKDLDIVLTSRSCGEDENAPMCGVPYHSVQAYIARLIEKGHKVAICEQVEDPKEAKGLVDRQVVRVISSGTVTDSTMLSEKENNFLCAMHKGENGCGMCFCDISTGQIFATHIKEGGVLISSELSRFSPKEVLLNQNLYVDSALLEFIKAKHACAVSQTESMPQNRAVELVNGQFGEKYVEQNGFYDKIETVYALGALINYLKETQKTDLSYINNLEFYTQGKYMGLDSQAIRNLEICENIQTQEKRGSLLWVLDKTKTSMGGRLLKQWLLHPLMEVSTITKRQNAVAELVANSVLRGELEFALKDVLDLERLIGRVVFGTANCRDLKAIEQTANALPDIKQNLAGCNASLLKEIHGAMDDLADIRGLIQCAIVDDPPFSVREGGMIKPGYDAEIDQLLEIRQNGKTIIAEIEAAERERTGIKNLKIGFNKVFGYYIEVTKSYISMAPEDYIRKQTLANCERYITQELKDKENMVLGAQERLVALEYEAFCKVKDQVAAQVNKIQLTASCLAALDALCSFATVSAKNNYTMPTVNMSDSLDIKDGRHPVVEVMLKDSLFVPNDAGLANKGQRVMIITGPNMAGKSTYMRQTALIVLMAQIGCFVPAKSADIGLIDRVFTRIGASDDLAGGRSTFMVEMTEVSQIIKNATPKSLIIFDEVGRGTSTFDGMSIARAVLEHTAVKIGAKTMFATHYHELADMEQQIDGLVNYNIAVRKNKEEITFLRKIVRGGADDSYGIDVARLAGIPASIINRAFEILKELEQTKPQHTPAKAAQPPTPQMSLDEFGSVEIMQKLKTVDVNVLSPIEAMNLLFELSKKARENG